MPDLDLLLEIILDFVADNSNAITAGTIIFGFLCLILFKRHKFLRPIFLLIIITGPALAFFASEYWGEEDKKPLPRRDLNLLVEKARYDFGAFKRFMDLAVKTGKLKRSAADTYLRQALRSYRAFVEKLNSVPRVQRKNFRKLQKQFSKEIKRAKAALGDIDFD